MRSRHRLEKKYERAILLWLLSIKKKNLWKLDLTHFVQYSLIHKMFFMYTLLVR